MVAPEGYIDVNVFVYWLGGHPVYGKKSYEWIKKFETSSMGRYVTSTLTLYQTIIIVAGLAGKGLNDLSLAESVVSAIGNLPGLEVIPLNFNDIEKALTLMKDYNLEYEDALHLAIAIKCGVKEIISNDKDFDRTPLKRKF